MSTSAARKSPAHRLRPAIAPVLALSAAAVAASGLTISLAGPMIRSNAALVASNSTHPLHDQPAAATSFALPAAPSRCSQAWRQSLVQTVNALTARLDTVERAIASADPPNTVPNTVPSTGPATPPPPPAPPAPPVPPGPPASAPATAPSSAPAAQVLAPIEWRSADGRAQHRLVIDPPAGAEPVVIDGSRGLDLSSRSDVRLGPQSLGLLPDQCDGLHVGNDQTSRRVCIDGVTVQATRYGAYLGGAHHWVLRDVRLVQAAGSDEHALRMIGDHVLLQRVTLDSSAAGKRTVWCYADDVAFIDCTLRGGAVWFGAAPGSFPGDESVTARRILVRGGTIEQTRRDMPAAIAVLSGAHDVVFERVAISAPQGNRATDIDSRRTGPVTFRGCTFNGRPLRREDLGGELAQVTIEAAP